MLKHSGATRAVVELAHAGDGLDVEVLDPAGPATGAGEPDPAVTA